MGQDCDRHKDKLAVLEHSGRIFKEVGTWSKYLLRNLINGSSVRAKVRMPRDPSCCYIKATGHRKGTLFSKAWDRTSRLL